MKQITIHEYGDADVLKVAEVEQPRPGPGEVLIKVEAAGINFSDILRRQNRYVFPTPLPFVLGAEAAGTIIELGEGVDHPALVPGGKALAALANGGGYSEFVVAPAQFCVPLPPSMPADVATGIFVQGTTAHMMMHHVAHAIEGKSILVHAASGGVGSLLAQLGKLGGATVIGATSSAAKMEKALSLGADAVVNYTEESWAQQVIEANQGRPVDLIFDPVGGDIFDQSLDALAPLGQIIGYGDASGKFGSSGVGRFIDANFTLSGFNLGIQIEQNTAAWQASLGAVIGLVAQGQLTVSIDHRFQLTEVAAAHRAIEARQTTGKVVLIPSN